MGTNGLTRRVEVLEGIAEEARIAPYRALAVKYGCSLDEAAEVAEFVERQQLRGCSLDELLERCADRWGLSLDDLRRSARTFGLDVD